MHLRDGVKEKGGSGVNFCTLAGLEASDQCKKISPPVLGGPQQKKKRFFLHIFEANVKQQGTI